MAYQPGETVLGEVTGIKPYGAFVKLPSGDIGMIHISEVAQEYVRDIHEYLTVGQEVAVKIIGVNEEGKYNLSIKQVAKQDEEGARYSLQVQEFRQALEKRGAELQLETSARRVAKERQRRTASSRASLLTWMKHARKTITQLVQRRESRERFYNSFDL